MTRQTLVAMAGLPGSGKSVIANGLGRALKAPVLSVDPIEAAMWASGLAKTETGIAAYAVAQALAVENLKNGLSVVIDAVNPVTEAREMWCRLAAQFQVPLAFIECQCRDESIHQARIEARVRNIEGMPEITWDCVLERKAEYAPWHVSRLQLDTSFDEPDALIRRALDYLPA